MELSMAQRQAVTNQMAARHSGGTCLKGSAIVDRLVGLTGWHRYWAHAQLRQAGTVPATAGRKTGTPISSFRVVSGLEQCRRVARGASGKR
jgi:hypothetical protein